MKRPIYSFIKVNLPYWIITLIYAFLTWVILGMSLIAFYFVVGIHCFTYLIAVSIVGEKFLRFLMGVRPPMTKKEKDYLIPIFLDVCNSVEKIKNKNFSHRAYLINSELEIFIDDSMSINAYCFGYRTLVVTRGAINTFSEEQLKGIIAHEYGHIFNGNTYSLLFNTLGNGILSIAFLPIKLILRLVEKAINFIDSDNIRKGKINPTLFILNIIKAVFNTVFTVFNFLSGIILSANSRYCEHLADYFVYLIGYAEELTESLYLLQQLTFDGNKAINKRLLQSHPIIAKRIERLETYQEEDTKRQQRKAELEKKKEEKLKSILGDSYHEPEKTTETETKPKLTVEEMRNIMRGTK